MKLNKIQKRLGNMKKMLIIFLLCLVTIGCSKNHESENPPNPTEAVQEEESKTPEEKEKTPEAIPEKTPENNPNQPEKSEVKPTEKEESKVYEVNADGTYTVQKGDTLSQIARVFGQTVEQLQTLNQLSDSNKIFEGQILHLEQTAVPFDIIDYLNANFAIEGVQFEIPDQFYNEKIQRTHYYIYLRPTTQERDEEFRESLYEITDRSFYDQVQEIAYALIGEVPKVSSESHVMAVFWQPTDGSETILLVQDRAMATLR